MALSDSDLITTIGGASSTSYVTTSEFATYRDRKRIEADAFDVAEPDTKIRALLMAADRMNRMRWLGVKANDDQALAWPRQYVVNPESRFARGGLGTLIDETVIPQKIKDAQCELAMAYLEDFASAPASGITQFAIDEFSVKLEPGQRQGLPDRVRELIDGLIMRRDLIRT